MEVIKSKLYCLSLDQSQVSMKATVLSPVSDSLVFDLSFPRAHTTTTVRQEKWIRIFQISFSTPQSIKTNFPSVCFATFSLLYDPCSILAIALYIQFNAMPIFILTPQSFCLLIGLFNWIVFPINRQLPEKTERDSKGVLTSHFLVQCFSSNSAV